MEIKRPATKKRKLVGRKRQDVLLAKKLKTAKEDVASLQKDVTSLRDENEHLVFPDNEG